MRRIIAITVAILLGLASEGWAANIQFACGGIRKLNTILQFLKPGDVLVVSGTCNENVVIGWNVNDITLDGQNTATIHAVAAAGGHTVDVRGRGITIQNFTIVGVPGNVGAGIFVHDAGQARITGNTITGNGDSGIHVTRNGSARILGNTIQGNALEGIFANHNSAVEIGDGASPNVITGNGFSGGNGIHITRSSSARVITNTISNNGPGSGVLVLRGAQADISDNTIDQNVGNGLTVGQNSTVLLGRPGANSPTANPNRTTSGSENVGYGLDCQSGSVVLGRLGTLNGDGGQVNNDGSCIVTLADFP
jgi:parallel beta-helix repeat protein